MTFEGALEVIRQKTISEEKPMIFDKDSGNYSNFYMSADWTALYNNYIISELALRDDRPTYKVVAQEGIRFSKQQYLSDSQYEYYKNTLVKKQRWRNHANVFGQ